MTTEQAPRELTDAQIQEIAHKDEFWLAHLPNAFCYTPFARAVIAADRALVASQAQPAAEPIGYIGLDWSGSDSSSDRPYVFEQHDPDVQANPLIRHPRQGWTPVYAAAQQPAEPRQDSVHAVESSSPPAAAPGCTSVDYARAAEMLRGYVDSIKEHGGAMLERWHYIPEVEEMADALTAKQQP